MTKVDPIPKGYHTVTPSITVKDTRAAIEFYKKAFAAEELGVCLGPDGKQVMHAEIKIGDSIIILNDEFPQMGCVGPETLGGTASSLYLYVENADSFADRAAKAGAIVNMPVADMFWGDRMGQLSDPFGHKWAIATHIADLSPEEMKKAQDEWMKKQPVMAK